MERAAIPPVLNKNWVTLAPLRILYKSHIKSLCKMPIDKLQKMWYNVNRG